MKSFIVFGLSIWLLSACQNSGQQESQSTDTSFDSLSNAPVGGHKDDHGCLTAAGETWSQLRGACVQVFNMAIRLNPVSAREGSAEFSAFALFAEEDSSRVELFLPRGQETSEVIDRSADGDFQSGSYLLKMEAPVRLYIDGKKAYQQDAE